jgi:hypothetical protein
MPFARCGRALGLESRRAAIALDPAQEDQHEQDHDDQSEPAAAVVAGAIERSSAHTGEPADKQDDKNNQDDRCNAHGQPPSMPERKRPHQWEGSVTERGTPGMFGAFRTLVA